MAEKHRVIEWSAGRWGFWFRVLGYGIGVRNDSGPSFSERNGYTRYVQIGRWIVKPLKPIWR